MVWSAQTFTTLHSCPLPGSFSSMRPLSSSPSNRANEFLYASSSARSRTRPNWTGLTFIGGHTSSWASTLSKGKSKRVSSSNNTVMVWSPQTVTTLHSFPLLGSFSSMRPLSSSPSNRAKEWRYASSSARSSTRPSLTGLTCIGGISFSMNNLLTEFNNKSNLRRPPYCLIKLFRSMVSSSTIVSGMLPSSFALSM